MIYKKNILTICILLSAHYNIAMDQKYLQESNSQPTTDRFILEEPNSKSPLEKPAAGGDAKATTQSHNTYFSDPSDEIAINQVSAQVATLPETTNSTYQRIETESFDRLMEAIPKQSISEIQNHINLRNINETNEYNYTPLHIAVDTNNIDIVQMCLRLGADTNSKDIDELTPLDWSFGKRLNLLNDKRNQNSKSTNLPILENNLATSLSIIKLLFQHSTPKNLENIFKHNIPKNFWDKDMQDLLRKTASFLSMLNS